MSNWSERDHPRWAKGAPGGRGGEFRGDWAGEVVARMGFGDDQPLLDFITARTSGAGAVDAMLSREDAERYRDAAARYMQAHPGDDPGRKLELFHQSMVERVALLAAPGEEPPLSDMYGVRTHRTTAQSDQQYHRTQALATQIVNKPKGLRRKKTWNLGEAHEQLAIAKALGQDVEGLDQAIQTVRAEYERRKSIPPWERGSAGADPEFRHYDAFVEHMRGRVYAEGWDPDLVEQAGLNLGWNRLDYLGPAAGMAQLVDSDRDKDPLGAWVGGIRFRLQQLPEGEQQNLRSAGWHYDHAMDAPEGGKEINLHIMAVRPEFSSSGRYEILNPATGQWDLLEDQEWSEADEELTVWAGDRHFVLDIYDDHPVLRRIDG